MAIFLECRLDQIYGIGGYKQPITYKNNYRFDWFGSSSTRRV